MLETGLEILNKIEERGFKAYIIGGFVRDYYLHRPSIDVDICTNATPKDLHTIFDVMTTPSEQYGSVTLYYKGVRFEITTFRKEKKYENNRRPSQVEYVSDLREDLKRRDFTINTLCMDKERNIIDFMGSIEDINHKIIRTIGNPSKKLKEDALRIMRAVRFATILDFQIETETKKYIKRYAKFLERISYERKRDELDKIFLSTNREYGISLLNQLGLSRFLQLPKLKSVVIVEDLLGIWAQLDALDLYPFYRNEKKLIQCIQKILTKDVMNPKIMYYNELYVLSVVGSIQGYSKKEVLEAYTNLPIHKRSDLQIETKEICMILKKEPGPYLKTIYQQLEARVLDGTLKNEKEALKMFVQTSSIDA